ncbi:hypothetical protein [Streptomyces litmocidini]
MAGVVEAVFPLAEPAEAHTLGGTDRTTGKLVLTVDGPRARLTGPVSRTP